MKCKSVEDFYMCELEAGHTCRHREGSHTWLDRSVATTREKKEQCVSTLPNKKGGPDFRCVREIGHKGKHDSLAGGFWTDGGAERIRAELAEQARRAEIEREPF